MTLQVAGVTLVHSSLVHPENWDYISGPEEAVAGLILQETPLCFYGHTHCPMAFRLKDKRIEYTLYETLKLEAGWKYLINPGSVGQPRDRDPRAAYAIYDNCAQTVTLYRLKYDLAAAQKKIRAARLPVANAVRLAAGY